MKQKVEKFDGWIQKKEKDILANEHFLNELSKEKHYKMRPFKDWDKLIAEREKLSAKIKKIPRKLLENLELKFDEYKMNMHNLGK